MGYTRMMQMAMLIQHATDNYYNCMESLHAVVASYWLLSQCLFTINAHIHAHCSVCSYEIALIVNTIRLF